MDGAETGNILKTSERASSRSGRRRKSRDVRPASTQTRHQCGNRQLPEHASVTVSDETLPHRGLGIRHPLPSGGTTKGEGSLCLGHHPLLWTLTGHDICDQLNQCQASRSPSCGRTRAVKRACMASAAVQACTFLNMLRVRTGIISGEPSSGNDAPCEAGPRTFPHRCS